MTEQSESAEALYAEEKDAAATWQAPEYRIIETGLEVTAYSLAAR